MTEVDLSDDQECERVLASCKKKWVDYIARKESKTMSDTTEQECVCCGFDTDCIDGLCQPCNDFNYKLEKLHKQVLNKPITEHPDVQRLVGQIAEYQIKNQELADKNVELQAELKKAHWAVALCLLKIADGKGVIGLIELPDGRVYSLPVEILAEAKQALKGETHDY